MYCFQNLISKLFSIFLMLSIFYGSAFAQQQIPIILNQQTDSAYVYESKLNFRKNSFGGLLLTKKMADNKLQVVLTSKFGAKIVDFTLSQNALQTNYSIEALNKNIVKKMFYKDLKMLYPFLFKNPKVKQKKKKIIIKEKCKRYIYRIQNNQIYLIRKGISTNKVAINQINKKITSLTIIHSLIDLKIEVKPLTFAE